MRRVAPQLSKLLMGMALVSYLVLYLAGALLHNHSNDIVSGDESGKVHAHVCVGCCRCGDADESGGHGSGSPDECPVCRFNAVVVGALVVTAVAVVLALRAAIAEFSDPEYIRSFQYYLSVYLRGPPTLSF